MSDQLSGLIPTILTQRLKLRPFQLTEAAEVQRMAGSEVIARMTATIPHPYPDGAAEAWILTHAKSYSDGESLQWAIADIESGKLMGCIGLGLGKNPHKRSEVGYWIGEEFWGRGYCTEALIATIDFVFSNFDVNKITSRHLAYNPASGKVMVKAGMTQEGYLKEDSFRNGTFADMVVYGLLRSEWKTGSFTNKINEDV